MWGKISNVVTGNRLQSWETGLKKSVLWNDKMSKNEQKWAIIVNALQRTVSLVFCDQRVQVSEYIRFLLWTKQVNKGMKTSYLNLN